MRLLYKTGPMESLRKWLYRPKRDDPSPLAQFFFADEALNIVATELDSFDGRKDPERCSSLVNQLQHAQDRVLNITNQIMDQVLGEERVARGFRVKFPEEVLQENLGVQLWFGAECLAAGSSIMNREEESVAMRPLAKALTRSLETVRSLLREQCLRPKGIELSIHDDMLRESLRICDRLFAEFELCYVSAMVNVKTPHEFEAQQLICVLFSETLRRALKRGILTQEQVDGYDPCVMFAVPRLAVVAGLLRYSSPPLAIDGPPEEMSDMFRPFRSLLRKIRSLLYTLDRKELVALERLLCTNENVSNYPINNTEPSVTDEQYPDIGEYVSQFYKENSHCKQLYNSQTSTTSETTESETQPDTEPETLSPEPTRLSTINDESSRKNSRIENDLASLRNLSTNGLRTFDPAVINEASMADIQIPDNDLVTSLNEQVTKIADRLSSIVNEAEIIDHTSGHSFSANDVPTVVTDDVFVTTEQLNLPSTSHGYLIPNAISQEPVVLASLSHNNSAIFNNDDNIDDTFIVADAGIDNAIVNSNICIANEMLSSILHDNNVEEENCVNQEDKVKFALGYDSDQDSPGDSGVSTENTSLDRSPDTENNKEHFMKQNRTLKNTEDKTENVLENSFSEFRENGDVTVKINYTESNSSKNEASSSRECERHNDEERNRILQEWGANTSDQEFRSIREVITELKSSIANQESAPSEREEPRRETEDVRQKKRKSGKTKKKRSKMWSPGMVLLDSRSTQGNNPLRLNLDSYIDDGTTSAAMCPCAEDEQIALALQAQELAARQRARGKFESSEDLVHRLFVCIAGVADQLQTNFAADLRNILKAVFAMNQSQEPEPIESEQSSDVGYGNRIQNGGSFDSVYSAEEVYADSSSSTSSQSEPHCDENPSNSPTNSQTSPHNSRTSPQNSQTTPNSPKELRETQRRNSMNQPTTSSDRRKSVNIQSSVSTGDLTENRVERAPEWVPDIAAPDCMRCAAHFTAFRRRHHCRNCGKVFCATCSSNSIPLPRYGQMKPVRVCEECFRDIAAACAQHR